jgi:predicted SAM-dependent methyltransferase
MLTGDRIRYGMSYAGNILSWPVSARRLRRLIEASDPPWRVHVGAGNVELPGWVNTDMCWRNPYWLDAAKPWPFPEGTVSHVYADNVVEHLPLAAGRAFLSNSLCAMKPGGKIRLVTPDARAAAEAYVSGNAAPWLESMRHQGHPVEHPVDLLRFEFSMWGHHRGYVYDAPTLRREMERAGFVGVVEPQLGESEDPAFRNLDSRQDLGEFQFALEGTKPDPDTE